MKVNADLHQASAKSKITTSIIIGIVRRVFFILLFGAILFISSGRWDWVMAWVLLGVYVVFLGLIALVLTMGNPEVLEKGLHRRKGAKKWDLVLFSGIRVLTLTMFLFAGLDERLGWPPEIPLWLQVGALSLLALGELLYLWAMAVNKFFSKFVRIQEERGQQVITAGPYQYVRHPGYLGWMIMCAAPPLILGSLWAFIPAGLAICLIVARAALEDRTLKEKLGGYKDYAARVRYRLLPGMW